MGDEFFILAFSLHSRSLEKQWRPPKPKLENNFNIIQFKGSHIYIYVNKKNDIFKLFFNNLMLIFLRNLNSQSRQKEQGRKMSKIIYVHVLCSQSLNKYIFTYVHM